MKILHRIWVIIKYLILTSIPLTFLICDWLSSIHWIQSFTTLASIITIIHTLSIAYIGVLLIFQALFIGLSIFFEFWNIVFKEKKQFIPTDPSNVFITLSNIIFNSLVIKLTLSDLTVGSIPSKILQSVHVTASSVGSVHLYPLFLTIYLIMVALYIMVLWIIHHLTKMRAEKNDD